MRNVLAEAGVDPERIIPVSDSKSGAMGCKELVELSHSMLPAAYRDSFLEAQRIDRDAKEKAVRARRGKASGIIAAAATTATGIGATPIPIADAALLIPVQTGMIAGLAALYGLKREALRHAVLPFVARGGRRLRRLLAPEVVSIPGERDQRGRGGDADRGSGQKKGTVLIWKCYCTSYDASRCHSVTYERPSPWRIGWSCSVATCSHGVGPPCAGQGVSRAARAAEWGRRKWSGWLLDGPMGAIRAGGSPGGSDSAGRRGTAGRLASISRGGGDAGRRRGWGDRRRRRGDGPRRASCGRRAWGR